MPQPTDGYRKGLIETAGGKLKCPLCRSDELRIVGVIVAFEGHRTYLDETRVDVEPSRGGKLASTAVVHVVMHCPERHKIELDVVETDGAVAAETAWEDTSDEPAG